MRENVKTILNLPFTDCNRINVEISLGEASANSWNAGVDKNRFAVLRHESVGNWSSYFLQDFSGQ